MLSYYWPVVLIVLSNVFYHICEKSTPENIHPMASLTVTYLVGAAVSAALYYIMGRSSLLQECRHANWSTVVLGVSIVGLEFGFMYLYKAGWNISTGQLVASAALAIVLIFVGRVLYDEAITWNKIAGVVICLAGLYLINK